MKLIPFTKICLLASVVLCVSCNEDIPCKNSNPLFDNPDYNTNAYKAALDSTIKDHDEFPIHYFLERFFVVNGEEYLLVNIKSKSPLCAQAQLQLHSNNTAFDGIRATRGAGYRGAELQELKIMATQSADSILLLATDVKRVVD